ncbi:TPA: hypothetical protein ACXE6B_005300, partial [Klebsiella variicola]
RTPDKYTGIAPPDSDLILSYIICIPCTHSSDSSSAPVCEEVSYPDTAGRMKDAKIFALTVIVIMMAVLLLI